MRLTPFVLCFCSALTSLWAYPVDYDETSVQITREALSELSQLIFQNSFAVLEQEFNDELTPINTATLETITSIHDSFSQRLDQIKESVSTVNADTTPCLNKITALQPEEYYEEYTQNCFKPTQTAGENLISLGFNFQTVVIFNKYNELMSNFNGCLSDADPTPRICAGIVDSTLREVQRIIPSVRANPLRTQQELKKQVSSLSDCAQLQILSISRRLQAEFGNTKACIVNAINVA